MLLETLGSHEAGEELRIFQATALANAMTGGGGEEYKIKRLSNDLIDRAYPERW